MKNFIVYPNNDRHFKVEAESYVQTKNSFQFEVGGEVVMTIGVEGVIMILTETRHVARPKDPGSGPADWGHRFGAVR